MLKIVVVDCKGEFLASVLGVPRAVLTGAVSEADDVDETGEETAWSKACPSAVTGCDPASRA